MPAMLKFLAGLMMYSLIFPKAYVVVIPRGINWIKHNFYDEIPESVKWAKGYQKFLLGLLFFIEVFIQSSWSAWVAYRILEFSMQAEAQKWLYFLLGALCGEAALGYIARKEEDVNLWVALRSIIPMGLLVQFVINPRFLDSLFGWLVRISFR